MSSFLEHCGLASRESDVQYVSGAFWIAQLVAPGGARVTLWGEEHNQTYPCEPCRPDEDGCWYLPLLLYYTSAPTVVIAEAAGMQEDGVSAGHRTSMLVYAQCFFTADEANRGPAEAVILEGRRRLKAPLVLRGRSRSVRGADGQPRAVSFRQADFRRFPLLPAQWARLAAAFPTVYRLWLLGWTESDEALETGSRLLLTDDARLWAAYRGFAALFLSMAEPELPADQADRLLADVLSARASDRFVAELEGLRRKRADGLMRYGDVMVAKLALFLTMMDLQMVLEVERASAHLPIVHAFMGGDHGPNVAEALVRRGYTLTFRRSSDVCCFHPATLAFRSPPAHRPPRCVQSDFSWPDGALRVRVEGVEPGQPCGRSGHGRTIVARVDVRDAVDPRSDDIAPTWPYDSAAVAARLDGPMKDVLRLMDFLRATGGDAPPWVLIPDSDADALRDLLPGFPPSVDHVKRFAETFLRLTMNPELFHGEDWADLVDRAYAAPGATWTAHQWPELAAVRTETDQARTRFRAAVYTVLRPMLVVRVALLARLEARRSELGSVRVLVPAAHHGVVGHIFEAIGFTAEDRVHREGSQASDATVEDDLCSDGTVEDDLYSNGSTESDGTVAAD